MFDLFALFSVVIGGTIYVTKGREFISSWLWAVGELTNLRYNNKTLSNCSSNYLITKS